MSDNLSFAHVRAKARAATCPGLNFWEKSCNGKAFVLRTIGVHAWLAELIWDKYCQPFLVPLQLHLILSMGGRVVISHFKRGHTT